MRQQTGPGSVSMMSSHPTNISGSSNPGYLQISHTTIDVEKKTWWIIYRVPSNLRNLNEDAYTPQLVSIGPLHYGQEKLNPMQEQKRRYLNLFLHRVHKNNIDSFKEFLKGKETDIRNCYYAENLNVISSQEFMEMMLLDSVFIVELFLRIQRQKYEEDSKNDKNVGKQTYSDDVIVKQSWLKKTIQRDLLLLENQIPLFILEELYKTALPNMRCAPFIKLAHDYFDCYHTYKKADSSSDQETAARSSSNGKSSKDNNTTNYEPQHFTDLIRSFYIYNNLSHRKKGSPLKTATKLNEAGVSFKKVIDRPLLDIKFRKNPILSWFLCLACIPKFKNLVEARLEIPQLRIDHTTKCVLSNIMAFEHRHYSEQPYVCDFVALFNSLIHTKEDVNLLVEKEVIVHTLRSDTDVKTLVHGLGRNVVTNETCYKDMIDELGRYYRRKWWNRGMLELRSVYFRDLWRASSAIFGLAVFMFSILNVYQTIRGFRVKH